MVASCRRCWCELCICGSHRCPPRRKKPTRKSGVFEGTTEAADAWNKKDGERRDPLRPANTLHLTDPATDVPASARYQTANARHFTLPENAMRAASAGRNRGKSRSGMRSARHKPGPADAYFDAQRTRRPSSSDGDGCGRKGKSAAKEEQHARQGDDGALNAAKPKRMHPLRRAPPCPIDASTEAKDAFNKHADQLPRTAIVPPRDHMKVDHGLKFEAQTTSKAGFVPPATLQPTSASRTYAKPRKPKKRVHIPFEGKSTNNDTFAGHMMAGPRQGIAPPRDNLKVDPALKLDAQTTSAQEMAAGLRPKTAPITTHKMQREEEARANRVRKPLKRVHVPFEGTTEQQHAQRQKNNNNNNNNNHQEYGRRELIRPRDHLHVDHGARFAAEATAAAAIGQHGQAACPVPSLPPRPPSTTDGHMRYTQNAKGAWV